MPEWRPELTARVAPLRLDPAREAEIGEDLSLHLAARYEELRATGVGDEEARWAALAELADPGRLAAEMRTLRQASFPRPVTPGEPGRHLLRDLGQDLRYGARGLRKRPG